MAGKKQITIGQYIKQMKDTQREVWKWEDMRNDSLTKVEVISRGLPNISDVLKHRYIVLKNHVKSLDNLFIVMINKPRRNGKPSLYLTLNKELDVFLVLPKIEGDLPMPRPKIDINRRKEYTLEDYMMNQNGGSMEEQYASDEQIQDLEDLESSINEMKKTINSLPMNTKNVSGGKRNKSKRNKHKRTKRTRRH
jgi:hypothetical protein